MVRVNLSLSNGTVCMQCSSEQSLGCLGSNYGASNYYVIIFIQLITLGCNIYEHENVVFGLLCVPAQTLYLVWLQMDILALMQHLKCV